MSTQVNYFKTEKYRENRKLFRYFNPSLMMFYSAKHRAKRDGLDFEIEKSDIIVPDFCPILGIPIFPCKGGVGKTSPTLDRIQNSRGYVKGNVRVISHRANTLKNELTEDMLVKLLQYVKGEL